MLIKYERLAKPELDGTAQEVLRGYDENIKK